MEGIGEGKGLRKDENDSERAAQETSAAPFLSGRMKRRKRLTSQRMMTRGGRTGMGKSFEGDVEITWNWQK